ncbi:class I adenylate-forming enzyme family protein [Streptomyces sp. ST2-7A]|uniref:AMP-binding protein n=1 Tax=Streptomyces sp. ST2-7A TaxID=2907214 RepID=UPI001F363F7E|nr:class I adenylate-forming enzyme family protein [Streptomyces sp. ST2-7A]MCE7083005.1 acyl--CoA ligase [Streptomyces sp. ST2-7A]
MILDRVPAVLRAAPERPAVLTAGPRGGTRIAARRGDLADLADACVAGLRRRGLRPGDTLGVAVRPGPRALAVLLAAHRLRLRVAVLDPFAGPEVLRARLALVPPALVVADAAAQAVAGPARRLARRAGLALPPLGDLAPVVATVGRRLPGCAPALDDPDGTPPRAEVPTRGNPGGDARDGDAVIVFTSGTTTRPRAVVHDRASLDAALTAVTDLVDPTPGRPVLGGTLFVLAPALARGATVALPARRPTALAAQLARLEPADTYLTPPALRAALDRGARLTGRGWAGSAPVPAALMRRARRAGARTVTGVYALTEMFPVAAVEEAEKTAFEDSGTPGDLVGAPLPGVTVWTDAGGGDAGGGELLLSGPAGRVRCLGERPDPVIRTGDRARLDTGPDGGPRVVLEGRLKDMVLRGAENIYPGLHEPALHVPGVEVAVLVGVPAAGGAGAGPGGGDDRAGEERLVALVEPSRGADPARLRAALRAPLAGMAGARPDAVVLAAVPRSGRSGKPDRAAASRLAAELLERRNRRRTEGNRR